MNDIFLGLGTNLGERDENLQRAVDGLAAEMAVTAVSPVYETPPWGITDQPDFFNICVAGQTTQPPHDLLAFIKQLEQELGREPTYRWGPRLIDIDLLFYDDKTIDDGPLTVPHPRLHERAFVLAPLADIAPDFVHPVRHQTVAEMLSQVDDSGVRPLPNVTIHLPQPS